MKISTFTTVTALAISVAAAATAAPSPTFHKDVLPVLQRNCQSCHRPGEAAPMSFLTYESTRPWAKAIKASVLSKKMPPWGADAHVGKFSNDRHLSQGEVETITRWVDSGAPAGNIADAPKPLVFADGWAMGKPDLVYEMPLTYNVPPTGTVEYTYFLLPTGLKQDTWVEASEIRPGDRSVVHHIIAFVREPGSKWFADLKPGVAYVPRDKRASNGGGADGMANDWLVGYAPGTPPQVLRPGQGRLIKAGSDIVLQVHYTASGKAAQDRSKVGLRIAHQPVKERILMASVGKPDISIPAGAAAHAETASIELAEDVKLASMLPHMHVRGKAFSYTAIYPDGRREPLLNVPRYDFNWQHIYEVAGEKVLPAGTRIECTAVYDNSANNAFNPDPTKTVTWGDQSWDEMFAGFFEVAVAPEKTLFNVLKMPSPPKQSE